MTSLERAVRVRQDIDPPYSMIEKAALAIMREDYPDEFDEQGSLTEAGQIYWHKRGHWYVSSARAAIAAIREPSEGMRRVGLDAIDPLIPGDLTRADEADVFFSSMIDALLAEGE